MKNWIKLAVAALALSAATVQAATDVKVGMSGRYFPFTFVKQDQLQGFEVDVWNEIGKRNDYHVEYVTSNFSGLFGLLETGRIDTISNQITITKERQAKYLFSAPYVIDGAQIAVRKGNDSIKVLKTWLVKPWRLTWVQTSNNCCVPTIKTAKSTSKPTIRFERDVALGRIDAFVMDRLSVLEVIDKTGLPLQLAGSPFETIENAWPFLNNDKGHKLQSEVNQALAAMRADGTLSQISEKWFGTDITK